MTQVFHPSTNAFARASIFGAVFLLAAIAWVWGVFARSSYITRVGVVRDQPVPFSHDHHVSGLGIDCRYCHTSVETSSYAGMPSTEICMSCHSIIWRNSPMLAPVRESFRTGEPLVWTRVYDVPDFVYFNHSIHIAKGVACRHCHGEVERMPLMYKATTLHMEWCLECHRQPQRFIRPDGQPYELEALHTALMPEARRDERYEAEERPLETFPEAGLEHPLHEAAAEEEPDLAADPEEYQYLIRQLTNCSVCHR